MPLTRAALRLCDLEGLVADETFVKIQLYDEQKNEGETYWAEPLGNSLYKLQNIPFFATRLNLFDIVTCQEEPNALPIILEVKESSGHRTVILRFTEPSFQERWNFQENPWEVRKFETLRSLAEQGVTWEWGDEFLLALDVPPESDYAAVIELLTLGKQNGRLDFKPTWN